MTKSNTAERRSRTNILGRLDPGQTAPRQPSRMRYQEGTQMQRFDVVAYRQVSQFVQVVVDAETEEEAREKAAAAAKGQPPDHW
jgi:hypothetical protein